MHSPHLGTMPHWAWENTCLGTTPPIGLEKDNPLQDSTYVTPSHAGLHLWPSSLTVLPFCHLHIQWPTCLLPPCFHKSYSMLDYSDADSDADSCVLSPDGMLHILLLFFLACSVSLLTVSHVCATSVKKNLSYSYLFPSYP